MKPSKREKEQAQIDRILELSYQSIRNFLLDPKQSLADKARISSQFLSKRIKDINTDSEQHVLQLIFSADGQATLKRIEGSTPVKSIQTSAPNHGVISDGHDVSRSESRTGHNKDLKKGSNNNKICDPTPSAGQGIDNTSNNPSDNQPKRRDSDTKKGGQLSEPAPKGGLDV